MLRMKLLCFLFLFLIGFMSIAIWTYGVILHHIVGDQKSTTHQPGGKHGGGRPIERPHTGINGESVAHLAPPSNVLLEHYNEFDVRSRLLRDKIQRLTAHSFIGHNQDEAEQRNVHINMSPYQNASTKHVHIFYSAPVAWYKDEHKLNASQQRHIRDPQGRVAERSNVIIVNPLNCVFYPQLGPYSISTNVLDIHFHNINDVGIRVIVVNWVPSKSLELIKHMMSYAKKMYGNKLTVAIELGAYAGRTASSVRSSLEQLREEFVLSHPAMYRVWVASRGVELPMVYVQEACAISAEDWAEVLAPKRPRTIRRTAMDAVFIGQVSTKKDTSLVRRGFFNGFYTRTASNGANYASTWKNWDVLKQTADKYHLIFIPTVAPGYNERKKEPASGGLRRHRSNGQYYGVAWRTAISLGSQFVSVASYNDWPAGTQIEEAIPYFGHKDYEPTGTNKYLDLTKHWVEEYTRFKEHRLKPLEQPQQQQQATAERPICADFFNNTIC